MFIDAIFFILIALACYKGLRKGFIIALFSVLGFVVGIAAALKLSSTVASKISAYTDIGKWLPALSFLLVFIGVAFLVNFCGKLLQKTFETIMLGWVNKLAGAALYVLLYSMVFSVFLFYAVQLHFLKTQVLAASAVYPYLKPLAPQVIESIAVVIPWFKNMFAELEQYFQQFASPTPIK